MLNCLMIQPKPPRVDLVRLMTLSGEVLRFEAKIVIRHGLTTKFGNKSVIIKAFIITFSNEAEKLAYIL